MQAIIFIAILVLIGYLWTKKDAAEDEVRRLTTRPEDRLPSCHKDYDPELEEWDEHQARMRGDWKTVEVIVRNRQAPFGSWARVPSDEEIRELYGDPEDAEDTEDAEAIDGDE
jgi:hypothetical protein